MNELIMLVLGLTAFVIVLIITVKGYGNSREEIDGVKSLHGIRYLIQNTDIEYLMYKLSSTCMSQYVKGKTFEQLSANTGLLTFDGVTYDIGMKGTDADMNVGATYKVQMTQADGDVVLELTFVENKRPRINWRTDRHPDVVLSQACHRFFKEQFDVVVLSKAEK